MAWWQVGAALLPSLLGAGQKRPDMPAYQSSLPDRSSYINQLLESGFDPQSDLYRLAQDSAMDRINRGISQQGLVGSSAGYGVQRAGMSDLANSFLMKELERRKLALSGAAQYDQIRAQEGVNAYKAQMDAYKDANSRQGGMLAGVGNVIGAIGGHYAQEGELAQREADRQAWRDAYVPKPTYGPPAPPQGPMYGPPVPPVEAAAMYGPPRAPASYLNPQFPMPAYGVPMNPQYNRTVTR